MKAKTFAVVDLEATSGSIGTGEKIIQFACVLYRDGQVIESFNTLVNPNKPIPKRISRLTGISDKDVVGAPYFEELAEVFRGLLEDTVFVAHNVSFDLRFLNEQFQSVGLNKLTNPAIDTVTLSKILFPQAPSYNLQELVSWLGYEMDQAHDALSDAEATVFLLDQLIAKTKNLPLVTLEQINQLSTITNYDNHLFFQQVLKDQTKGNSKDLANDLLVYQGLVIKDPAHSQPLKSEGQEVKYPSEDKDKESLFRGTDLEYRPEQMDMMNRIHHYLNDHQPLHKLAIEAPAGIGKSIAYLFPLLYQGNRPGQVVVSTYTKVLQDQLVYDSFPRLNKILPFNRQLAILKGKANYLSLAKFIQLFRAVEKNRSENFYIMQLLVWLTETETGDLAELHLESKSNHSFWDRLRVRSLKESFPQESTYDFYKRALKKAKQADIIVTNHKFLLEDLNRDPIDAYFDAVDYLIVDEAHHFPRALLSASRQQLSFSSLIDSIKDMMNKESQETLLGKCARVKVEGWFTPVQVQLVQSTSELLFEQVRHLQNHLDQTLLKNTPSHSHPNFWVEKELRDDKVSDQVRDQVRQIVESLENLTYYTMQYSDKAELKIDQFSNEEKVLVYELKAISHQFKSIQEIFKTSLAGKDTGQYKWLSFVESNPRQSLNLQVITPEQEDYLLNKIHQINHIVFTSSTLAVDGSTRFFERQLAPLELNFIKYNASFPYHQQVKILVAKTDQPVNQLSHQKQVTYLRQSIETIYQGFIDFPLKTLSLFHSRDLLEDVYRRLAGGRAIEPHALYAQELSGSKQKVLRSFKQAQSALLLGADTYFEGIDLPGSLLELVILTKIPFDSPNLPLMNYRNKRFKEKEGDLFADVILPEAILKMKQAMGRLIRQRNDRGVFIVLDNRFLHANYSKAIQNSFPHGVEIQEVAVEDMAEITLNHLTD